MCWEGYYKTRPVVLTEDKTVYKVGHAFYSSFSCKFRCFTYMAGKIVPEIKLQPDLDYEGVLLIEEGYHSYSSIEKAGTCADLLDTIGKFIIPKGSTMYINNKGEIVSSSIIYVGPISNTSHILNMYTKL